ncbi:MAG: hypothetical protein O2960_21015, partial [Verrucomicrobia bacterium]|nr:hypothetical protein [Verrucomicrobiota bacterium]
HPITTGISSFLLLFRTYITLESGLVSIIAGTDFEILGRLVSGATVTQQFDAEGDRIGETFTWSTENGLLHLEAGGQAYVGGKTVNKQGETIETGVAAYAKSRIKVIGGKNPEGIGVKVHPASELIVNDPAGSIDIESFEDADIQGVLVAGGEIQRQFDPTGQTLGREILYFDGDSTVRIQADHQIRIGQTIRAGKQIDFVGGLDPVETDPADGSTNYSGRGIVLYGSVRLITSRPNSTINLNAPGPLDILAPEYSDEVEAQGWITTADGRLSDDVTLDLFLDLVDFEVRGSVDVFSIDTEDNSRIGDLMVDLRSALAATQFRVTQSDNADHPVATTFSLDGTNPEINVELRDGRLVLAGPYDLAVEDTSLNAGLLGFDLSQGTLASDGFYAVYAPAAGSIVNIGAPDGPNGRLYIAGMVLGHSGLNLYSGVSAGGVDLDLDVTGLLETVDASIILSPGDNGVVKGDVVAGGAGSNVEIHSARALTIQGHLEAAKNIVLTAGTDVTPGETSITTTGTSKLKSTGGNGEILITGLNDVVINSLVGPGSVGLSQIRIESQEGELSLARESGWIETDVRLLLLGKDLDLAGVVRSLGVSVEPNEYEVEFIATNNAQLHGDMQFAGSVLVSAGANLDVYNTVLRADGTGQTMNLAAVGNITLGREAIALDHDVLPDGQRFMQTALITADTRMGITAGNLLTVNSGSRILASGLDSQVDIDAGSVSLVGSIYGGATVDENNDVVWTGNSADVVISTGGMLIGGSGFDDQGARVKRGGSVQATGLLDIVLTDAAGSGLTLSKESFLRSDATGGGTLTSTAPSEIRITSADGVTIFGLIEGVDDGADVYITAAGLIVIDGLVQADDQVVITGGTDSSGAGIIVQPLVLLADLNGNLIDEDGNLTDADGFLVNESGEHLDSNGVVTTDPGLFVEGGNPVRVSGGTVDTTGADSAILLSATDDVVIYGTVGELSSEQGEIVTDVDSITLESTQGDVSVVSTVSANEEIILIGMGVNLLAGSTLKTRRSDGRIIVRGGNVLVADGFRAALVDASTLVHIVATHLRIDGLVQNNDAATRILLNVENELTVTGQVRSLSDIEINAGIDPSWSDEKLISGTILRTELSGGDILIEDSGLLNAGGEVKLTAGGDVDLQASASLQTGTREVATPVISTEVRTIRVVTGFHEEALSIIEVPEISWVKTRVTKQVDTDEVRAGRFYHSMDVTLTQDGYYNPSALEGAKFRETLIEGVDYYNSTDYLHNRLAIPVIDWSIDPDIFIADPPSSNYRSDEYKSFNQLNDSEREVVLAYLGYKPLYDFSYTNAKKHETLDGVATISDWVPDWKGNSDSVYSVDVAEWRDKYIRMPEGSQEDVLRVVTQGEPKEFINGEWTTDTAQDGDVVGEYVGQFRNSATALYTQINSEHQASGSTYYRELDHDNSPIRWKVSYYDDGLRWFDIFNDGRNGENMVSEEYFPDWQADTYPADSASRLFDKNGVPIYVQNGYISETSSITGQALHFTHSVDVGDIEDLLFDYYVYLDSLHVWGNHSGEPGGSEFRFRSISAAIRDAFGNNLDSGSTSRGYDSNDHTDNSDTFLAEAANLPHGHTLVLSFDLWEEDTTSDDHIGSPSSTFTAPESSVTLLVQVRNHGEQGFADVWFGVDVTPHWVKRYVGPGPFGGFINLGDVYEDFHDYRYDWTSNWHDIYDKRRELTFEWTSQSHDIYDQRPRYATVDKETMVVKEKSIVQYETVADTEEQTIFSTQRIFEDPVNRPFGAFDRESILAVDGIRILAIGDIHVSAVAKTLTGSLILDSIGNILVEGSAPEGATDPTTVAAAAQLLAAKNVTIIGGAEVTLANSSFVGQGVNSAAEDITIRAGESIALSGTLFSSTDVVIIGDTDIDLSASIIADGLLDAKAGQGQTGTGSITANIWGDLQVPGGEISLVAGAQGGDISLQEATLAATVLSLTAPSGSINHADGLLRGVNLVASSLSGVKANSLVQTVDAMVTGSGNIEIVNGGDVSLDRLDAFDGSISVESLGSITAVDVRTRGTSDENDVSLSTFAVGENAGDLAIQQLAAGGAGDITLRIQGALTQNPVANGGWEIVGDALDIEVPGGASLEIRVNTLIFKAQAPGDVVINQGGSGLLRIDDSQVFEGSFTLAASGAVDLAHLELLTNDDASDVVVAAGGAIGVGFVKTGAYYTSINDVPTPPVEWIAQGAEAGVTAHGDVSLSSGGGIHELGNDGDIDLITDQLTLQAESGITQLEVAANELLSVATTSGDIELFESDGQDEKTAGLEVSDVNATAGSVTLRSTGRMTVSSVVAMGADSIIRLVSETGNLEIVDPGAGLPDALRAGGGYSLIAGGELISYDFFQGPKLVEYRASGGLDIVIPSSITADTIALESGAPLTVVGTLTASDRVELISGSDVFMSGDIVGANGPIGDILVVARGERVVTSTVLDAATGMQVFTENGGGATVLFDSQAGKYFKPVTGGKYVFSATYKPASALVEDEVRTYFADVADPSDSDTLYESSNGSTFTVVSSAERERIRDIETGYWNVTANITNPDTQLTAQEVNRPSGDISILTTRVPAQTIELRALRDILADIDQDLTVNGFLGGVTDSSPAANITLRTDATLTFGPGTLSAMDRIELRSEQFSADAGTLFVGEELNASASGNVTLNTRVETLVVDVRDAGNLSITEADAVTLSARVEAGSIAIAAGGDIFAIDVQTLTDGSGKNISMTSGGNIYVDYIETAVRDGAAKTAGSVTLDAQGSIREPDGLIDNDEIDISAFSINLTQRNPNTEVPVLRMIGNAEVGIGTELEIAYNDSNLRNTFAVPTIHINGDYVLNNPGNTDHYSLVVTGNLTVNALGTQPGIFVSLTAGGTITVNPSIDVGSEGRIILGAGSTITTNGALTAGSLTLRSQTGINAAGSLSADSLRLTARAGITVNNAVSDSLTVLAGDHSTLTTNTNRLYLAQIGAGKNVSISEQNGLSVRAAFFNGGDLSIVSGAETHIDGPISGGRDVSLTTNSGGIAVDAGVTASRNVNLVAATGVSSSAEISAAKLTVASGGDVDLTTRVATLDVVNSGASGGITIDEVDGNIDINRLAISHTGNGGDITLSTSNGSISTVAGQAGVSTAGSGDITLTANGAGTNVFVGQEIRTVTGSVNIQATAGGILDVSPGEGPNIVAGNATLTAGNNLGAPGDGDLDTRVGSLTAHSTANGDIYIDEVDALSITSIVTGSNVVIDAGSSISTTGSIQSADLSVVAAGSIQLNTAVTNLSVDNNGASGAITISEIGSGGDIVVERIRQAQSSNADKVSLITENGNIYLDGTVTGNGLVELTAITQDSTPGAILDGDSSGAVDIVASTATLIASTGIGSLSNSIETQSDNLEADAGSGGIWIANIGNLVIGEISAVNGLRAEGSIVVTTAGTLTLPEGVTGGDDVSLNAGNNVRLKPSSVVTAFDLIAIRGDFGNSDPGTGALVELQGSLDAQRIEIFGEADADTILLQPVNVIGHLRISGQAGNDLVTIDHMTTLITTHDRPSDGVSGAVRDTVDIDGGEGADETVVNVTAGRTDYIINVHDTGSVAADADVLTINGTEVLDPSNASGNDLWLLRRQFIAYLTPLSALAAGVAPGPVHSEVERINYDATINGRLQINSLGGDDQFSVDDNSSPTILSGGSGADRFQIGQLYASDRTVTDGGIDPEDVFSTTEVTRGFISNGITNATTIEGDGGADEFVVYHNLAALSLNGGNNNDRFEVRAFALANSAEPGSVQYTDNQPVQINGGIGDDSIHVIATEFADDTVVTEAEVAGAGLGIEYGAVEVLDIDGTEGSDRFFVLSIGVDVVTRLYGGLGGDYFSIAGDAPQVAAAGYLRPAESGTHTTDVVRGPLHIDGVGGNGSLYGLAEPVVLPGETNQGPARALHANFSINETGSLDAVTVFNDGSQNADVGSLSSLSLLGLGMVADGIAYGNFEMVELLLGSGNDQFTVNDTSDGAITSLHGGGGEDTITANSRGGVDSRGLDAPLVIFGDTSQDGSRYLGTASQVSPGDAWSFTNPGADTINASVSTASVSIYGGIGDDVIHGSQSGDHLAGGSGDDQIFGQDGVDHIYGDSGINVDLASRALTVPTVNVSIAPNRDALIAGADVLRGNAGADVILGDHGVITQAAGTQRILTTGQVARIETVRPSEGAIDTIYGDDGFDLILGGNGGDTINAGTDTAGGLVVGDHGWITLDPASLRLEIVSTSDPFLGAADHITAGGGNDIVMGGPDSDTITVSGGQNIVLGDNGTVTMQHGTQILSSVVSTYLSAMGQTFLTAGDDTIITGQGDDLVIGGLGDDAITIAGGNNIVMGDDASVTFQAGSGIRDRIESLYLNGAGLSAIDATEAAVGDDVIVTG